MVKPPLGARYWVASNPCNIYKNGGDERIRTSDQSFSPDAPLAGECLRPARPRLRINAFTTPHSLTDYRQTVGLLLNPYF